MPDNHLQLMWTWQIGLILCGATAFAAEPAEDLAKRLEPFYEPPAECAGKPGDYKSPLEVE